MSWANFHTHTRFCDGSAEPNDYVLSALQHNFFQLGFSGHAPVGFKNEWNINVDELPLYCQEINVLKKKYRNQIEIFLGLEADYIPGETNSFSNLKKVNGLDFIIGSVHLVRNPENDKLWFIDGAEHNFISGLEEVFHNDIKHAVGCFFKQTQMMLEQEIFDIIGHFDKIKMNNKERFFSETDDWYRKLLFETIELIRDKGVIVEINTRGLYTGRFNDCYPGKDLFKHLLKMNIPVTISTDAHKPEDIGKYMKETACELYDAGFRTLMMLQNNEWEEVSFDIKGI